MGQGRGLRNVIHRNDPSHLEASSGPIHSLANSGSPGVAPDSRLGPLGGILGRSGARSASGNPAISLALPWPRHNLDRYSKTFTTPPPQDLVGYYRLSISHSSNLTLVGPALAIFPIAVTRSPFCKTETLSACFLPSKNIAT